MSMSLSMEMDVPDALRGANDLFPGERMDVDSDTSPATWKGVEPLRTSAWGLLDPPPESGPWIALQQTFHVDGKIWTEPPALLDWTNLSWTTSRAMPESVPMLDSPPGAHVPLREPEEWTDTDEEDLSVWTCDERGRSPIWIVRDVAHVPLPVWWLPHVPRCDYEHWTWPTPETTSYLCFPLEMYHYPKIYPTRTRVIATQPLKSFRSLLLYRLEEHVSGYWGWLSVGIPLTSSPSTVDLVLAYAGERERGCSCSSVLSRFWRMCAALFDSAEACAQWLLDMEQWVIQRMGYACMRWSWMDFLIMVWGRLRWTLHHRLHCEWEGMRLNGRTLSGTAPRVPLNQYYRTQCKTRSCHCKLPHLTRSCCRLPNCTLLQQMFVLF